jgi:hypothetical protein
VPTQLLSLTNLTALNLGKNQIKVWAGGGAGGRLHCRTLHAISSSEALTRSPLLSLGAAPPNFFPARTCRWSWAP